MATKEQLDHFFQSSGFGVVGASADRSKFGNRVVRAYQEKGLTAIPVNPRESSIEGVDCVSGVADLPPEVKSISIITPPQVTEKVVTEAIGKGIANIWMQPGAESNQAVEICRRHNINVIADGTCVLVVLGYREH